MSNYRENVEKDMRYLELLAQSFPTVAAASTEIINLQAILNLPKGTEHFLADLHGAFPPFQHVLKNASGNIKRKVSELFGNEIRESDKRELCTLIYYPEQKLELVKQTETDMNDWYHITIHQLVRVCRDVSSKYTRSKVRKALPADFSYIIQELLHERTEDTDKAAYVKMIINSIIDTGRADDFIIAICNVIQRLAIDKLHILGDIYDRGPNGVITTFSGWVLVQETTHVSATLSVSVCAMLTLPPLRRHTVLTWCPWLPSPWRPMAMTLVRSSCRGPLAVARNSMRRMRVSPR